MTRLIISFCLDLTDPQTKCLEVGVLSLRGEDFVGFRWSLDWQALPVSPFCREIFATWPNSVQNLVEHDWPASKGQGVFEDVVDFVCHTLRHSSLRVSRVERSEEMST